VTVKQFEAWAKTSEDGWTSVGDLWWGAGDQAVERDGQPTTIRWGSVRTAHPKTHTGDTLVYHIVGDPPQDGVAEALSGLVRP
jgi:hypothetical protein